MAVDQAGRDPAAFAIDHLRLIPEFARKLGLRSRIGNAAVPRGDSARLHDAETGWPGHGGEAGVSEHPGIRRIHHVPIVRSA
jgi:hypothetical protein